MSKTALVVDDSKSARFALRKFLEGFNYKVDTAESAYDAYKQLAHTLPEVIFLDHIMPGVDGFEALRVIKSDPLTAAVPVVICSSNEGEDFVSQAKARGASDVLQKPPSPEQIAGVLANLVSRGVSYEDTLPPAQAAAEHMLAMTLAPGLMPKAREPSAMERLMATIPPKMIPTAHLLTQIRPPGVPPAAMPGAVAATLPTMPFSPPANKVQPIREPAVAIQQAVMKSLRDAAAPPPMAAITPTQHVMPSLPSMPALSTPAGSGEAHDDSNALRFELESRLKKISQDLFAEVGSLRAQLATLGSTAAPGSEEKLRAFALEAARVRTNALAQSVEQHLTALRNNLDVVLRAQNERMEQIAQIARQAAAEECERAVMKAAQRISDQMAESILKTLGPQLANLGRNQS